MKVRHFILGLLVGVCLKESYDRLVEFYSDTLPVAKVGECLDVYYGKDALRGMVVTNSMDDKSSILQHDIGGLQIYQKYSFKDLRDLKAKKVNCDEETN